MIQFIGYNFLCDGDGLNPYPTTIGEIDSVQIQNAIYNDLLVTSDVISPYDTTIPTDWDIYTILFSTFEGTITGGSVDYTVDDVDSIRIKKRKKGEFEWITIYEQFINGDPNNFHFSSEDYFSQGLTEYEYAWVPVLAGNEGEYIIESIESKFNGVFICDSDTIFKFNAGVAYGPSQQFQQVGIYNPLGRKYPIYISNGAVNYQTGSVTGKIIGNYENTGVFDRKEMVVQKNALLQWLTNKKAKILKDFNSNIWLIFITEQPSISYNSQWGNNMMEVSFQYGEIGDVNNIQDMQNVGLIPITTQ